MKIVVALVTGVVLAAPAIAAGTFNAEKIEQLTGAKGKLNEKEGVFKVSMPRSDLAVTVAGVTVTPPMGLTSWAAFEHTGKHTMVMGDLVLEESQVNPVMDAALGNGLEVTALHNHFLWDSPRIMFMHIGGMGDEETLAKAVGAVFSRIKETSGGNAPSPKATIAPSKSTLDPKKIDQILGKAGDLKDGVYKVTFGTNTSMHGTSAATEMGVNTWAAFVGSDESAVVDGDFAMRESELQPVLKALRHAGINIVAIHQHMVGEQPRILFLHFWGLGSTESLANGIKEAMATQGGGRSGAGKGKTP